MAYSNLDRSLVIVMQVKRDMQVSRFLSRFLDRRENDPVLVEIFCVAKFNFYKKKLKLGSHINEAIVDRADFPFSKQLTRQITPYQSMCLVALQAFL